MDYSTTYFNKQLDDLVYQDIIDYFVDPKEESTKIEFKSYSTSHGNFSENLNGVIRGICAFLNSEGGIVIWGAPEGIKLQGQDSKIFQGQLSPLSDLKEKDWLINKISDLITPLPIGINVKILQENADIIYIFEIQISNYAPHQFKNTYWARLDGQTKPAPHYLIEALFRKIRYPNLEGYIRPDRIDTDGQHYILYLTILIFNFSPLQNEEDVSFRLMCPQGLFLRSQNPTFNHMYFNNGHQLVFKNLISVLHYGSPNIHLETIIFNPQELLNNNNIVNLILSFGGKYSPLKTSTYKMDFNLVNWSNRETPNYLFTSIEENILPSDKQRELGVTRESSLTEFLRR
jgi:hypothetical protein